MQAMRPILIVEDDSELRQTVEEHLLDDGGFTPICVGSLEGANTNLNARDARLDAIILDVNPPDGDGSNFCAQLRRLGNRMPIIMLTGCNAEDDIVRGLDAVPSDYIRNPFRSAELAARLRTQLRILENSEDATFDIGPFAFHPARKLLVEPTRNSRIRLNDKKTWLLEHLYRAGPRPVARQVLLNEVWGYNGGVTTHTLETHIYRLRQKIESSLGAPSLPTTEPRGDPLNP